MPKKLSDDNIQEGVFPTELMPRVDAEVDRIIELKKTAGRPKTDKEKRIRKLSVYLTQTEFNALEEALNGQEKTRFVVDAIAQKIEKLKKNS